MDALFNLFKIKFDKINELLSDKNNIQPNSTINIYINLEMIWRLFLNKNNEELMRSKSNDKILDITSNIINLASHYRLFCKKYRLRSRIILYTPSFDNNISINTRFNKDYRRGCNFKYTIDPKYTVCRETIKESIKMAKTILVYIEDVHLIESGCIEPSMIPYLVNDKINTGNDINFLISNDIYDFQYTNHDFYVFKPAKEKSLLIRKGELIDTIKTINKIDSDDTLSEDMYTFILAIIGDRNRSLEKIKGVGLKSLIKLIKKAEAKLLITENTTSINLLINMLKDEVKEMVTNNFYCVDIDFQKYILPEKEILYITSQINNRFDVDSLRSINDNYFSNYPIQLLELNNIIPETKKNNIKRKIF